MISCAARAIKSALENRYDIVQVARGNYLVTMKWDGYSAMIDVYKGSSRGRSKKRIFHWDSLDKQITVTQGELAKYYKYIKKIIEDIRGMGYKIEYLSVTESSGEELSEKAVFKRASKLGLKLNI